MTSAAHSAAHTSALGLQTFAVVVSCGVTPYLDRTLRAVAAQTRPPEVVLLIDAASRANGLGDGTPVEDTVAASGLDAVADVRVVRTPEATTFLAAVRQGLNRYAELVAAGERRRTRTVLTPTRRGDRHADLVTIRVRGPLGLAGRQVSLRVPARVRVLPAFASRRHLPSRLARLREMDGRSAVNVRGAGTEFDSLREYVVGDDVRSIDWRSTARRGEVLVRTWRPERDRRVLIIIDSGRLSAARLGDAPRLDAQIEATLLLAALASRAGDRVDVLALDDAVRAQVRGTSGPVLMSALADHLATVEPRLTELDWTMLASRVRTVLSQRALVVVISALDGSGGDAAMIRTLTTLARDHTVVLASALDPELEELRAARDDTDSVYVAASAEKDLVELEAVRRRLRRGGVEIVEAPDQGLAPALADCYLSLKAAGRL